MRELHLAGLTTVAARFVPVSSTNTGKKKRAANLNQCHEGFNKRGDQFIIVFSVGYPAGCATALCKTKFDDTVQSKIAAIYFKITLTITFTNGQSLSVKLSLCLFRKSSVTETLDENVTTETQTTVTTTDMPGYSVYPSTTIAVARRRRRRSITRPSQSIAHMPIGGGLLISLNHNTTHLIKNLYEEHSFIRYFPFGVESLVGIDGKKIDLISYLHENKISKFIYNQLVSQDHVINGNYLTMGALGCLESHVRAWQRVVELNMPMLVLEDDVHLNKELLNIMFPYLLYALPTNFSLFYFGNLVGKEMEAKLIDYNELLWKIDGSNWGTYAYIISPSCAATLLDFIYPVQTQVDSMIIDIAQSQLLDAFMSKIMLVNTDNQFNRNSLTQRYLIPPIIIPRVFHFIWLNNNSVPDATQQYIDLWKTFHPNWEILIWTHETIANRNLSLHNQKRFQNSVQSLRQASDILRYEILYQYGGIYIDVDFEPLKNIEPLLHGVEAFVAYESDYFICNGILGAIPGHDLTQRLITGLETNLALFENGTVNQQTGPYYITRQVKDMQQEQKTTMKDGFQIFAPHIFFPYAWYEKDPGHPYDALSFVVHHFRSITQIKQDAAEGH
ncbi:unnamed protein product [Rotaria sp. Silwood2]|nr:unnamed protein product [Rotaria sp. Silwood2]CAF4360795.1 unnamed protein product [Rotaria sp. Silwood2]